MDELPSVAVVCETKSGRLVAPVDCDLRSRCIKCGTSGDLVEKRVTLAKNRPMYRNLGPNAGLAGYLAILVAGIVRRRRSRHRIHLCRTCLLRWRLATWLRLPALVLVTALAIAVPAAFEGASLWVALLIFVVGVVAVQMGARAMRIHAKGFDEDYVHIDGVSPEYIRVLGIREAD